METTPSPAQPLVILNPAAHRGRMEPYRRVIRPRVDREGAEYVETRAKGEATELARKAAEAGRPVIVVGGDGSINEVVNGLLAASQRVPFGIVPAGSGNDYACNTLKLPHTLPEAIEIAFHGNLVDADAGIANDRFFANSFSVGLDADVAKAAEGMKHLPFMSGPMLYYASSLRQLFFAYRQCPWLTVQLDGQLLEGKDRIRHVLVAITNGPTYGGGFRVNPTADFTDGQLDVCSIRYMRRMRAIQLLPIMKKGQHVGEPEAAFYRAHTIQLECPNGVNAQMDGETMRANHYEVRVLPRALLVRVA
jgi:diacylglycerol kinase (ATP)